MNVVSRVHAPWWWCFHWTARVTGAVLFVGWLMFVLREGYPDPASNCAGIWAQMAALLAVFISYAVGVRNALGGGVMGLVALAAFYAVNYLEVQVLPSAGSLVFALPSVLYLVAYGLYRAQHRV